MPATVTFLDENNPELSNKGWKVMRPAVGASTNFVPSAVSQQSPAGPTGSRVARVGTDSGCRFEVGVDPTCTTASPILPASTWEYILIDEGDKVAILNISGV